MSLISAAKIHAKAEIEELENLLKLSEPLIDSDDPNTVYIAESKSLLSKASAQLDSVVIGWKMWKVTSIAFDIDMIDSYVSSIRYNLAYVAPKEKLPLLIADARRQLFYLPESERDAERETLDDAFKSLEDHEDGTLERRIRNSLANVIASVSEYRKIVWHKSSMIRSRLMTMLFVIIGLLVSCYAAIPWSITIPDVHWCGVFALVFAVQILGAAGGALSAMQSLPEGARPLHELYLQETLMYLRPAVGAGAALGLTLMQIAEVVEIFPLVGEGPGIDTRVLLFVAFLAGFSERFFIGHIETLVGGKESQ